MPPGPLYNWLCVLHSASEILAHAAAIRASQLTETNAVITNRLRNRERPQNYNAPLGQEFINHSEVATENADDQSLKSNSSKTVLETSERVRDERTRGVEGNVVREEDGPKNISSSSKERQSSSDLASLHPEGAKVPSSPTFLPNDASLDSTSTASALPFEVPSVPDVSALPTKRDSTSDTQLNNTTSTVPHPRRNLQASKVPSSRLGRLFHYGGLAASLGYGATAEALRRVTSPTSDSAQSSIMMSSANVSRLVEKLSMMRGAALKLGQFMSIQDSHLLPKDVEEIFRRVQDSAHYMPNWQMARVLSESFGTSWASNFASFDPFPFAAASLGQVHSAVLSGSVSPSGRDEKVAVKIQFPDIAKSIDSDLGYLKLLLTAGRLLPKGLFLDKTLKVMRGELADECDYTIEATAARFFSSPSGLANDQRFRVPWVWSGSTKQVLVMQFMEGVSVGGNVVDTLSQETRDEIATRILDLCMKELFEFRMMQTDPNWSNFLWNEKTQQIELIDFGATRSYSKDFIDNWMHILQAAVTEDRDECVRWSLALGYLTGEESEAMIDAHVRSLTLLATPFRRRVGAVEDAGYAFGRGSEWANITTEIRSLIPTMLNERLTPPPRETYSLNRKLSGAFLLASRLGAKVKCRSIWEKTVADYKFEA